MRHILPFFSTIATGNKLKKQFGPHPLVRLQHKITGEVNTIFGWATKGLPEGSIVGIDRTMPFEWCQRVAPQCRIVPLNIRNDSNMQYVYDLMLACTVDEPVIVYDIYSIPVVDFDTIETFFKDSTFPFAMGSGVYYWYYASDIYNLAPVIMLPRLYNLSQVNARSSSNGRLSIDIEYFHGLVPSEKDPMSVDRVPEKAVLELPTTLAMSARILAPKHADPYLFYMLAWSGKAMKYEFTAFERQNTPCLEKVNWD